MTSRPMPIWYWAAGLAITVHFCLILALGLSRHWGYMSSINDLGVFDQAVWGTLHGQFLLNSSNPLGLPINWLGFHFHLVLLLFVPLYAISPSTEWFALAQSLALSLSAWPVFLLAFSISRSQKTALLWMLAYLANPFLLNAAAWDFHPITLAVPLIATGMLAIERSDSRMLLLSCLPLLLIQEHLGLTVACFGLLWWLRNKTWSVGLGLVGMGVTHSVIVMGFIMPALSPLGSHLMLSPNLGQLSRYHWLGNSIGEILQNLALHPWAVTTALITQTDGVTYLALLLLVFIGLPLAAPVCLLPALPDLAANLLSSNSMPRSAFSYHSVGLIPILAAAAMYGARSASQSLKRFSLAELSGLALAASFAAGYGLAPLPLPGARDIWAASQTFRLPDPSIAPVLDATGKYRSLSVQTNIGAHFSQRKAIYPYPEKVGEADAIVLRLSSPTTKLQPLAPWYDGTLAWHLQMRPDDFLRSVECLLRNREYGVVLWSNPWLVLAKHGDSAPLRTNVLLRLNQLYGEWQLISSGARNKSAPPCDVNKPMPATPASAPNKL